MFSPDARAAEKTKAANVGVKASSGLGRALEAGTTFPGYSLPLLQKASKLQPKRKPQGIP
jgi:hypothetical protein